MTISLETIPSFTAAEALTLTTEHYGLQGTVRSLPSERDQNFLITDAYARRFVLKIANSGDAPSLLEFQNQAMQRVAGLVADCRVQRVVASLTGEDITAIQNSRTGTGHCVRLMTWLDGEVLADCTSRGPALFDSIGTSLGKIDTALSGFTHPAMRRVLQWDLRLAGMARDKVALLPPERRARIEQAFSQWETIEWAGLRQGVIHGDANDHNIIVGDGRMVGLLDFGDMTHTATVCDLAVALAYVMLDEEAPLPAAAQVIRAYQRHHPLTEAEQGALFPLILSRLCTSVCYAAHNRARNPGDPYQVVTEAAAWALLDKLEAWSAADALTVIRAACASPDPPWPDNVASKGQ
jgi:Ser/Thr protein kinase RdoA (MazF antagonist)